MGTVWSNKSDFIFDEKHRIIIKKRMIGRKIN